VPFVDRKQIAGMNIHYLFYSLDYFLKSQQKAGIKTVELWGGAPHFYMDAMEYNDCKYVRKKANSYDLKIEVFTPESIIYPYNVAAPGAEQFKKSKLYFTNAVKATAELGAKIMTINSGYGYLNESKEEAWKRSADMLAHLANIAEQEGITIAMETLRPEESKIVTTMADASRMQEEINSASLKLMIDTVSMGVAGETLDQWFETFGRDIIHLHFIDGRPYGHLAWGDGNFSAEKMIQILNDYNYKGFLGQEITEPYYFENPRETDQKILQNLRDFIQD